MGKNQSASNLTNIIQYNNGNIAFVSGSTTLMQISSSGAITTTGVISGSNALSASYAATASFVNTAQTASFVTLAQTASFVANAQSASNAVTAQTASFANAFTVAGTLTAQTLVVQTITSSVDFVTGSTRFGSLIGNTHVFTGSVNISPTLTLNNFLSSGSYPLNIAAYTEPYVIGTNSYKSLYVQSGTALTFASQISNFTGSSAFLIDINAYSSSAATNVYFGAVAGPTGNGPANFVIGRRTAVSTWVESLRIDTSGALSLNTGGPGLFTLGASNSYGGIFSGGSGAAIYLNGSTRGGTNTASSNAAVIATDGDFYIANAASNSYKMFVSGSGNVGIGTTGPNTRLQILGSTIATGSQNTYALGIGNSSGYDLTFGTDSSYSYIQSWTSKPLSINGQGNSVVFPNISTNVAIGTNTPSANGLTIFRDGSDRKVMLELNRNNNPGLQSAIQFTVGSSILVGQIQHEYAAANQNHMSFTLRNPSGGNFVSMWLQNDGNVGIGTTSPTKTLTVNGRMSTTAIVSGGIIAGNIASNMPSSPAYIPLFNLSEAAGFSLTGFVNAASYTCFNISQIYIRKEYTTSNINAGITGLYKNACDFSIVNITYGGVPYVALRFTSNPEIDVVWTGYLLTYAFNSDGSAQVWTSGVTLNSTYASY